MNDSSSIEVLARARLPVMSGQVMEAVVLGTDPAHPDVIALVHRNPAASPDHAVVRLHSACITGEALGSAKCDCGIQLDTALAAIAQSDWGVVIYLLRHEGRGIGLVNKIRAYALQEQGFDTVSANLHLGFNADDRDFAPAVRTLEILGIRRVALLTNNPEKIAVLRDAGVDVIRQMPMEVPVTEHNRGYLLTKRRFFGHLPPRDPATGFLTPAAAAERFRLDLQEVEDGHAVIGAVIVDVHSFDYIGSQYGMAAADAMIGSLAPVVRQVAHPVKSLARVEEDRFLWLFSESDEAGVRRVAARLEQALAGLNFAVSADVQEPIRISVRTAVQDARADVSSLIEAARRGTQPVLQ
jgi:GTP cyclohydrolase II